MQKDDILLSGFNTIDDAVEMCTGHRDMVHIYKYTYYHKEKDLAGNIFYFDTCCVFYPIIVLWVCYFNIVINVKILTFYFISSTIIVQHMKTDKQTTFFDSHSTKSTKS